MLKKFHENNILKIIKTLYFLLLSNTLLSLDFTYTLLSLDFTYTWLSLDFTYTWLSLENWGETFKQKNTKPTKKGSYFRNYLNFFLNKWCPERDLNSHSR